MKDDVKDMIGDLGANKVLGVAPSKGGPILRSFRAQEDAIVGRIRFPPEADSKRQGKLGLHVGAPREALDFIPCERGKPAGGLRSPPLFTNRIRNTNETCMEIAEIIA